MTAGRSRGCVCIRAHFQRYVDSSGYGADPARERGRFMWVGEDPGRILGGSSANGRGQI